MPEPQQVTCSLLKKCFQTFLLVMSPKIPDAIVLLIIHRIRRGLYSLSKRPMGTHVDRTFDAERMVALGFASSAVDGRSQAQSGFSECT